MLIYTILVFAFELILMIISRVVTAIQATPQTVNFAWFTIIAFVVITLSSLVTLFKSIHDIKYGFSKGKAITATAFSGATLFIAAIFDITVLATYVIMAH